MTRVQLNFKPECTAQSHAVRKLNNLTGGGADGSKYGANRFVDWELGSNRTNEPCGDESEQDTNFCETFDVSTFRSDIFVTDPTDGTYELAEVRYWTKPTSHAVGQAVEQYRLQTYSSLFASRQIVVDRVSRLRNATTGKGTGWAVWYTDPCLCRTWYAWAPRPGDEDGTFTYWRSSPTGAPTISGHIYFTDDKKSVPSDVNDRAVKGDAEWTPEFPPTFACELRRTPGSRYSTCRVTVDF